jgi:Neurotransmitter-gated ion-channel transmembrane region
MFMVASSVVLTVVVLNYHHRRADMHEMPSWVRTVFLLWLPWILRMKRPGKKLTRKTILMNSQMKELDLKERSSRSLLANVLDMEDDFRTASIHRYPRYGAPTPPTLSSSSHGQSFGSRPTGFEDDSSSIPCLQVRQRVPIDRQRHLLSIVATSGIYFSSSMHTMHSTE